MTELGAVDPLDPEDRKTQDQQDQENHDKDVEQEAGDIRCCSRYAGKAEDAGNNRHQKEDQGPFQKDLRPRVAAPCKIADLTSGDRPGSGSGRRVGGVLIAVR